MSPESPVIAFPSLQKQLRMDMILRLVTRKPSSFEAAGRHVLGKCVPFVGERVTARLAAPTASGTRSGPTTHFQSYCHALPIIATS